MSTTYNLKRAWEKIRGKRAEKKAAKERRKAVKKRNTVEVTCAFCGGGGRDPHCVMSYLSDCPVCLGKGVVQVETPHVACAHCRGTGAIKKFTCTVCGGKGFVPALEGPTVECPECDGTGDNPPEPAMACIVCLGRGRIPASPEDVQEMKREKRRAAQQKAAAK